MQDYTIVNKYLDQEARLDKLGLKMTVNPSMNSFRIQDKNGKILSLPSTVDGIQCFIDGMEYSFGKA